MTWLFLSVVATLAISQAAHAATYHVGAAREAKTLSAVLPRLQAGDVVEVDAGVYMETARITARGTKDAPIIIRGVGGERAIFDGDGIDASGKGPIPRGIFQVEGAYITIEHLEFRNARNGDNAAGIRLLDSTNATIRDCKISRCDMGIFGGDKETATIEACQVLENGTEAFNGYSHNFYMSGNRVVVRGCEVRDALYGQNYKSRAHYNELWQNTISGSQEGEVGFVDSEGNTDKPHSNALMVGNTITSRADRKGNTSKFVLFGSESGHAHDGALFLFRNTFIAGDGRTQFVTLDDPKASVVALDNTFTGSDQILRLARPPLSVRGAANAIPKTAKQPAGWHADNPDATKLEYEDGEGLKHTVKER